LAAAIAAFVTASNVSGAATEDVAEWTARLEFAGVVDGETRVTTPVTIGVAAAATDGFDRGVDLLSPPLPPGPRYAEAHIHRPEASAFFRRLNRDIRGPALGQNAAIRWDIVVANSTAAEWTMSWDPDSIPAEWREAWMTCDHLPDIDMRATASAVVSASDTCVFAVTVARARRLALPFRSPEAEAPVTAPTGEGVDESSGATPGADDVTDFRAVGVEEIPTDVDGDGVVDLRDLMFVARVLGDNGNDAVADVDGDGRVTVRDLIRVASDIHRTAAAPARAGHDAPVLRLLAGEMSPEEFVRRVAAPAAPGQTRLLPNYPNPFNPETWIPFELDKASVVTVTLYDMRGSVVRVLELGHREPGNHRAPGRAAYWDGRTDTGETASSGAYVVALDAGGEVHRRRIILVK